MTLKMQVPHILRQIALSARVHGCQI